LIFSLFPLPPLRRSGGWGFWVSDGPRTPPTSTHLSKGKSEAGSLG
jgi:hypothetical protein